MITIYATTHYYFRRMELLTKIVDLTEKGLLDLVNKDRNAIWFVEPHSSSVFREKFIECCMDDECFLVEGFYSTELCGEHIDYRIIEDANAIMTRAALFATGTTNC